MAHFLAGIPESFGSPIANPGFSQSSSFAQPGAIASEGMIPNGELPAPHPTADTSKPGPEPHLVAHEVAEVHGSED
jgi:hypothetical protein